MSKSYSKTQSKLLLKMKGISKTFSGVEVLHDVGFDLRTGEVHILAGENGAGKSTLIKILGGVYTDHLGSIELNGGNVDFKDVWFAYNNDDYVLKDISFSVNEGETVAIVGATGAGKSSIINLLNRFKINHIISSIMFCDLNLKFKYEIFSCFFYQIFRWF